MSLRAPTASIVVLGMMLAMRATAVAADGRANLPAAKETQSAVTPDEHEGRRVAGMLLLGAGALSVAVGATMALHYNKDIGGCDVKGVCTQEDGRVPLGLGLVGVGAALAFVGVIVWLQVPATTTRIGLTSSGATLAGCF
jgi:hypothetical protein